MTEHYENTNAFAARTDIVATTRREDGVLVPAGDHVNVIMSDLQLGLFGDDRLEQFAGEVRDCFVGERESEARAALSQAKRADLEQEDLAMTGSGLVAIAPIAAWQLPPAGQTRVSCGALAGDGTRGAAGDWPAWAELYVMWLPALPGGIRFSVDAWSTDDLTPAHWTFELQGRVVRGSNK